MPVFEQASDALAAYYAHPRRIGRFLGEDGLEDRAAGGYRLEALVGWVIIVGLCGRMGVEQVQAEPACCHEPGRQIRQFQFSQLQPAGQVQVDVPELVDAGTAPAARSCRIIRDGRRVLFQYRNFMAIARQQCGGGKSGQTGTKDEYVAHRFRLSGYVLVVRHFVSVAKVRLQVPVLSSAQECRQPAAPLAAGGVEVMARIKYHNAEQEVPDQFAELFNKISTKDLARQLGTDEETATEALVAALPALLAKLQDNAMSERGASSLASALQQHNNDLARGPHVNLDQVDTQDGNNILQHIFGNERQQVTQQLASDSGRASSGILESLLPMIAPIAMSFLSNQFTGGNRTNQQQSAGPDLGGLLSGLLGGRQAGQSTNNDGGLDIGGLLGGFFGKRS